MLIVIPSLILILLAIGIAYLINYNKRKTKEANPEVKSERNLFNKTDGLKQREIDDDRDEIKRA